MNKKTQKWVATAALGTLAMTALAGCSGNKEETSKPEESANATATAATGAAAEKPLDISIMLPIFKTNFPKDDGPVVSEIEKLTNTNIHLEWVPNASYGDKFNITLASTKLPEIIYVPGSKDPSFVNAVRSGAFWEVGPYLKDYPNLSQANEVIMNNSSIDGKNYGIYRGRALGRNGIVYRKDWLDAVGLEQPKTIDDFYNMLKAFKEKDPDKNGKNDTYGMVLVKWTGGWASAFDTIKLWFGAPNKWGVVDGKLVPEHQTPEYLEALKFMKKLYDEKLINQDFAVFDSAKWVDPVVNGQAGVIVDVTDTANRIEDKIHAALAKDGKDDPNAQYMSNMIGVTGADGQLKALPTSGFAGLLAIPKTTVKTEEELKRVLKFLDQMNEPELTTLAGYGIEGKHYTLDGEALVPSKDAALLESEVEGLNQMLPFIPEDRGLKVKQTPLRQQTTNIQKEAEQYIVANPAEPFISDVYSQKGQQLDNIINDARIKFIVGQTDEAGLMAAFETWKKSGGDDLVKEMNELYAASAK
ncbi:MULTISPECIES: extracellular solute-binding protein [unclassified Paenibacillus]|uniref:extracellular solute-binding protein n=1 Tax=unclassified Paenibacillus TaxID=185978 RepID=UPI001048E7CD|nr:MULTISPECIES: extracellular solute-binding protein [unclassified Paenibacillus]NIK68235.1 putative aldouronate transport system substrate-binding protein [Paenibacillus sp. BK720]TCM99550.1 carbohydrate ABC transporter substrate-binding protein (CUT1 family) [Paenibacillus sp. BK033]